MTSSFPFARAHPLLRPLFAVCGMGPKRIGAELVDDAGATTLRVRMGWAFSASVPVAAITSAARVEGPVLGWGVHGFGGRWLVNTTGTGLVTLEIAPAAPCRVLGLPIGLRWLRLSLADPDSLVRAVGHSIS